MSRKIAIAMSGGVDSSVVAHLLSQSHPVDDLLGIHMSNWDYHNKDGVEPGAAAAGSLESSAGGPRRCWEHDWKDAQAVAQHLQIPIHHVSFEADYWNDVFEPYCQQLAQAFTPNPDVDCNRYIKFGVLKDYARNRFHVDRLATGHYARLWDRTCDTHDRRPICVGNSRNRLDMPDCLEEALDEEESTVLADYLFSNDGDMSMVPVLLAARDRSKDQSYFLSGVPGKAFSNILFPLGELYKTTPAQNGSSKSSSPPFESLPLSVRQLAQKAKLPNASKRDSVGICFVGKRKHGDFISEYVAPPTGSTSSSSSSSSTPATVHTSQLHECINVENGTVIATFDPATHPSLTYATTGQGAKISGASQRWFVADKRDNKLWLCPGTHHPALYSDRLYIRSFNWITGGRPPPLPFRAKCRIRHLQPLVDCEITYPSACATENGAVMYEVRLDLPLRGIACGQVCAIYAGGRSGDLVCMGGGAIVQRGPTYWEMQQELPPILHPAGHNDRSSSVR